jgi:hypothetical protein
MMTQIARHEREEPNAFTHNGHSIGARRTVTEYRALYGERVGHSAGGVRPNSGEGLAACHHIRTASEHRTLACRLFDLESGRLLTVESLCSMRDDSRVRNCAAETEPHNATVSNLNVRRYFDSESVDRDEPPAWSCWDAVAVAVLRRTKIFPLGEKVEEDTTDGTIATGVSR